MATELEQLRQEAEQLKVQIRVGTQFVYKIFFINGNEKLWLPGKFLFGSISIDNI